MKHNIDQQLTDTLSFHAAPRPLCGTLSFLRSLESIAAITRKRHNGVNRISVIFHASMIWRMQGTAMCFCKNQT